jgi:hypothetical protein
MRNKAPKLGSHSSFEDFIRGFIAREHYGLSLRHNPANAVGQIARGLADRVTCLVRRMSNGIPHLCAPALASIRIEDVHQAGSYSEATYHCHCFVHDLPPSHGFVFCGLAYKLVHNCLV